MAKLVIVESPAKAKTIQKYLGKDYEVMASNGHIRDLPKSKFGIDLENDYTPQYIEIAGKESLVKTLKREAKKSDKVYLATDPDREGEAISWHLAAIMNLDPTDANRVTFNEITKSGVKEGMDNPRQIDIDLVNAQQARRVLDRIVGYKLSPFLWRKVRRGLSAGRVQSVAVRLIVDREEEIKNFKTEEYWSIDAKLAKQKAKKTFPAKLHSYKGKKIAIGDEAAAKAALDAIKGQDFVVEEVKKSVRKKSPMPPFITSTLQQEASKKLNFQSRRTMKAAQELYEGVEVEGLGAVGLITYMRTDSLRISAEALAEAADYIEAAYGKAYLPKSPRVYKSKKNAQDAHECIRPSMPSLSPDKVKGSLSGDQYKLYKLIWERFIASQMETALLDAVSVKISAGEYTFAASGFTVKFDGYTKLYEVTVEEGEDQEEQPQALPDIAKGEALDVKELAPNQHFTQPPPRYTEASLIKALEENGIGRPSTYAPTITTVINRGYVERDKKALLPTGLGEVTTKLMEEQFERIVDATFTANMEEKLDAVEEGKSDWVRILDEFYSEFATTLEQAEKNMEGTRVKVPDEATDVVCENCGKNMVIKLGRFGKFLACPGFPECRNTKKIVQETGGLCPVCGKKMLAKKSKNGKGYFGCEGFPECTFMTWDKPLPEACPKCSATLFRKMGRGGKIHCLKEGCGFEKPIEKKSAAGDED
ncbi:MAG: type I DNA topoisomerase [Oscillospiraceae bacterium]|nr:type I DNA topoisomerase [Oscillospiraceae bacterium]